MMDYRIEDDFLDKEVFEQLKHKVLYGGFPWYYSSNVSGLDNEFYFANLMYDHMTNISNDFLNVVIPIISKIQPTILIRVKANLYPNLGKQVAHTPHKDYNFPHNGAIFYVNNNNGPTILGNDTKIYPKENRILFFDPSKLHSSSSCTDSNVRVNININFLKFY